MQLRRMRQSPAQIPLFDRTGHCRILSRSVRRSHLFYRNSLSVNLWTSRYLLHRAHTTRKRIEPGCSFPPATSYLTALIRFPLFLTAVHRCSSNAVQSYSDELALAHKFGAKHKHSGPRVRRLAMNEKRIASRFHSFSTGGAFPDPLTIVSGTVCASRLWTWMVTGSTKCLSYALHNSGTLKPADGLCGG